jgi:hypothetical protein
VIQKIGIKSGNFFWMFRLFSKTHTLLVVDEGNIQKGMIERHGAVNRAVYCAGAVQWMVVLQRYLHTAFALLISLVTCHRHHAGNS